MSGRAMANYFRTPTADPTGPGTMTTGDAHRSTSRRVIEAVADETGTDQTELEPLYRTLDPDSLDALFSHPRSGGSGGILRVEFTFGGCRVVVSSDDTVAVSAADEATTTSSTGS